MTDFQTHLTRQIVFSKTTFGPGARTKGVIDHIRKELIEVEESGGSANEWVDVVILALDGLTRQIWHGTPMPISAEKAASIAVDMILFKQHKNERRDWPDWRTQSQDAAIEHVQGKHD
jgi:hypothetical protein